MAQNLTYTRCGDYLISDIQLSHISDKPIGKYGRMRRAFLAENNPECENHRSGSLPGSHSPVRGDTAEAVDIRIYGIPEGEEQHYAV